jgi:hypothetical protein
METTISPSALSGFFAWAPLVLGIVIYATAWASKRHEDGDTTAAPIGQTFACANCGKRGIREHMVPQTHAGAISYYCASCAGAH